MQIQTLADQQDAEANALMYRAKESLASHLAAASSAFAQATNGLNLFSSVGLSGAASAYAGVSHLMAKEFGEAASAYEQEAMKCGYESRVRELLFASRDAALQARDGFASLVLQFERLAAASAKVRLSKAKANRAASKVTLADYWDCGTSQCAMPYNTALRRTYNTQLLRYRHSLKRAKKAAFVARRAIETRFGVHLPAINQDLKFVEAPRNWADTICDAEGIDYAAIRTPDGGVDGIDFSGGVEGDNFASAYVGDYVRKLEDFVRSYPFDFRLKDGDDIAVLSLAEDILRPTGACSRKSTNLLLHSADLSQPSAWQVAGCDKTLPAVDGGAAEEWHGCIVAERITQDPASPTDPIIGQSGPATRVRYEPCLASDPGHGLVAATCPDTAGYLAKGRLQQRFVPEVNGMHAASVEMRWDGVGGQEHLARIAVRKTSSNEIVASGEAQSETGMSRRTVNFDAVAGEEYALEIQPSTDELHVLVPGDETTWPGIIVASASVQYVGVDAYGVPNTEGDMEVTGSSRGVLDTACSRHRSVLLKNAFAEGADLLCSDGIKKACDTADETAKAPRLKYWETSFDLPVEADLKSGIGGQISLGNFNYRHASIAVNLVGTGLSKCDDQGSPSCYGNGFAEYTLLNAGPSRFRNWDGTIVSLDFGVGRIEHAKALATERLITNPPSSSDEQLLSAYVKREFMGRPLDGHYRLRIWDSGKLDWSRLEDVQIVLRYHYWTRFSE